MFSESSSSCATLRAPRRGGRRSARRSTAAGKRGVPQYHAPILPADDPARPSDEELLGRYRDLGRADDFDGLVRRYSGALGRYLVRYLGDPTLADDVLQNTFLQIHTKCKLYRDGWPARPWIYSIATHQAIDALRRTGRHAMVSLDQPTETVEPAPLIDLLVCEGPDPLEELQEEERQRWVKESIARLPESLRQALILAYHQGLKYSEVAEILRIPLGTVKTRLHAAIALLRQRAQAAHLVGSP